MILQALSLELLENYCTIQASLQDLDAPLLLACVESCPKRGHNRNTKYFRTTFLSVRLGSRRGSPFRLFNLWTGRTPLFLQSKVP